MFSGAYLRMAIGCSRLPEEGRTIPCLPGRRVSPAWHYLYCPPEKGPPRSRQRRQRKLTVTIMSRSACGTAALGMLYRIVTGFRFLLKA